MIDQIYKHYRPFMDLCQTLSAYAADSGTCKTLYRAVEDLRPPETATALIDAIAAVAPPDMPTALLDDAWALLDDKQWHTPCPFYIPMVSRMDGMYRKFGTPCGKSWCPECGVKRAQGILDRLREHFQACDGVWIAVLDSVDETVRERLSTRARSKRASYAWVRRLNGVEVWFASRALGGPKPPHLFTELTPPQAFLLARIALLIPYWDTARASRSWQWPGFWKAYEPSGEWKKIVDASGARTVELAEKLIMEEVAERIGISVPLVPNLPPEGVSLPEWFDLLKRCYEEARLPIRQEPDSEQFQ